MSNVQTSVFDDFEYARGCRVERLVIRNRYFTIPVAITRSAIRFAGITVSRQRLAECHRYRKSDLSSLCGLLCVVYDWGNGLKPGAPKSVAYIHAKTQKIFKVLGITDKVRDKLLYLTLIGWTEDLEDAVKKDFESENDGPQITAIGVPPEVGEALSKAIEQMLRRKNGPGGDGNTKH